MVVIAYSGIAIVRNNKMVDAADIVMVGAVVTVNGITIVVIAGNAA